jgi:hypothetical protein
VDEDEETASPLNSQKRSNFIEFYKLLENDDVDLRPAIFLRWERYHDLFQKSRLGAVGDGGIMEQ